MVERCKRFLFGRRWVFRLFCCFLAVLTSLLTLFTPFFGVVAQTSRPSPQSQPKKPDKSEPDPQVLVAEVVVTNTKGDLANEFVNRAYKVIKTKPGIKTTKAALQEDINAIFATGYFSNVKAVPEDTPLGVRVTFEVVLNPVIQKVQLEGKTILPDVVVEDAFRDQYGNVLNLVKLQEGIKKVNKWYQDNGYVLAQVVDAPQISGDGIVTLTVAEGIIEEIQVQFLIREGDQKDSKELPVVGKIPAAKVLAKTTITPGELFNRKKVESELQRVFSLNLTDDVKLALKPGQDPRKVVIVVNMINESTALKRAAEVALNLQDEKNFSGAINQYQRVLQLARNAHSKPDEAFTLINIANAYKEGESYRQAKGFYYQAIKIFQESHAQLLELATYINLGEAHRQLGELDEALDSYQKADKILSSFGENPKSSDFYGSFPKKYHFVDLTQQGEVPVYQAFYYLLKPALAFDIAISHAAIGDYQQSLYMLNESYPTLANSLKKLNTLIFQIFDKKDQRVYEKYEYAISQTVSQLPEIITLLPYNFIYSSIGDTVSGAIYTEQAREKTQALLNIWKRSISEKDTDSLIRYIRISVDFMSALLEKENKSQKIAILSKQMGESLNLLTEDESFKSIFQIVQPYVQVFLSSLLRNLGNDEESLSISSELLKLLDSSQSNSVKQPDWLKSSYPWLKATLLDEQGAAQFRLGRYREALTAYRQAIEVSKPRQSSPSSPIHSKNSFDSSVGSSSSDFISLLPLLQSTQNASRLLAISKTYEALGEPENARGFYNQFLKLPNSFRSSLKNAEAHYGAAKAEFLLGNIAKAKSEVEAAIKNSEQPSSTLARKGYGSGFSDADLKYGYGVRREDGGNRGSIAAGFGISSTTLDPFTSNSNRANPAIPCNEISAYFVCKQKYFEFYINLLSKERSAEIPAFEASERARSVTAAVFRDKEVVSTNPLQKNEPAGKLAGFKRSRSGRTRLASVGEIQSLLDEKTLLLEYFLGEKESYLWAVSKDSLKTYFLPGRSTLEPKAREFYDLLTTPTGRVRPKTTAKVGKELSAMLLGQVSNQLGKKRLLIVGDGILQYIPFSALPDPAAAPDLSSSQLKGEFALYMQPLLVDHEVVNLLSASAIVEQRQSRSRRPTPTKELAVFADPVFNYEDGRVKQFKKLAVTERQPNASLAKQAEPIYTALPGTKQEFEQISQFVPLDQQSQFSGFDANYETAISDQLKQYRRIHFATHGFFNTRAPEQSGIILSAISKDGELQRGSITPATTFSMDLSAADLVVLSGCRTGLSGDVIREGLTGLTGGLMSAGAERVVASLWSVNDEATKKLMTSFYRNMYKKNLSPAQALRSAQLSLWQDERWQTPYNWAAFTLYGEWK